MSRPHQPAQLGVKPELAAPVTAAPQLAGRRLNRIAASSLISAVR
jgi:hypothetical protein